MSQLNKKTNLKNDDQSYQNYKSKKSQKTFVNQMYDSYMKHYNRIHKSKKKLNKTYNNGSYDQSIDPESHFNVTTSSLELMNHTQTDSDYLVSLNKFIKDYLLSNLQSQDNGVEFDIEPNFDYNNSIWRFLYNFKNNIDYFENIKDININSTINKIEFIINLNFEKKSDFNGKINMILLKYCNTNKEYIVEENEEITIDKSGIHEFEIVLDIQSDIIKKYQKGDIIVIIYNLGDLNNKFEIEIKDIQLSSQETIMNSNINKRSESENKMRNPYEGRIDIDNNNNNKRPKTATPLDYTALQNQKQQQLSNNSSINYNSNSGKIQNYNNRSHSNTNSVKSKSPSKKRVVKNDPNDYATMDTPALIRENEDLQKEIKYIKMTYIPYWKIQDLKIQNEKLLTKLNTVEPELNELKLKYIDKSDEVSQLKEYNKSLQTECKFYQKKLLDFGGEQSYIKDLKNRLEEQEEYVEEYKSKHDQVSLQLELLKQNINQNKINNDKKILHKLKEDVNGNDETMQLDKTTYITLIKSMEDMAYEIEVKNQILEKQKITIEKLHNGKTD